MVCPPGSGDVDTISSRQSFPAVVTYKINKTSFQKIHRKFVQVVSAKTLRALKD